MVRYALSCGYAQPVALLVVESLFAASFFVVFSQYVLPSANTVGPCP